jgi:hypothetical protein
MGAVEANAPNRFTKQLVALTAMKFMQEVLEITWRRLLVTFQSKQLRDFVVVKVVHQCVD